MYADDLIKKMQDCVDSGDPEIAHSRADDILVETCKATVKGLLTEDQVNIITDLFEKVEKWYA